MSKAEKIKTYESLWEELCDLSENVVGEIFNDELIVSPRPSPKHAEAISSLSGELFGPFKKGKGGPGGWWILNEPELHFEKPPQKREKKNVVVPDLAGWKVERLPEIPEMAYFELPPDWVCEVLSPSTARYDRISKMRIYAVNNIPYYWIIDSTHQTLEVFVLQNENYQLAMAYGGNDKVSAPPFDAIEIDLSDLWGVRTKA